MWSHIMQTNRSELELPNWNVNTQLSTARAEWDQSFDKNYQGFSQNMCLAIAADVFAKIKESLDDPFKKQPTKDRTLTLKYNFDILDPDQALIVKKMAQDAADKAPFKEWFVRLAKKKQEITEDDVSMSDCCSSGITLSPIRNQSKDTAIDGTYFKERMALIGELVYPELKKIFEDFSKLPGNNLIKFKVDWYGGAALDNIGSFQSSNDIAVEIWIDKGNSPQPQPKLESMQVLLKQKAQRESNQRMMSVIKVVGFLFAAVVVITAMYYKEKSRTSNP